MSNVRPKIFLRLFFINRIYLLILCALAFCGFTYANFLTFDAINSNIFLKDERFSHSS